jgi:hypothetical protein
MHRTSRRVIKVLLVLVASTCFALAGLFLWMKLAPRHVPAGQAKLVTLGPDSLPAFRDAFNAAEGEVRVLAMLSPT